MDISRGLAAAVLAAVALAACSSGPATGITGTSASTSTTGTTGSQGAPGTSATSSSANSSGGTRVGALHAALAPWSLPAPVSRPVVVVDGGRLLVLGGLTTGDVSTASIQDLDPASGAPAGSGRLASAVHDAAGAVLAGSAYVFGGGAASSVATVQAWDPASGGTARTVGDLPQPRSDLQAAVVGTTAYVVGGYDGTELTGSILATTDGTRFHVVGALVQPVRYPAVATDSQGRIWIIGGETGASESAGVATDDIQRFDPATGRTTLVAHLPAPIGHAAAASLDGTLFVLGGRSVSGPTGAVWRIDPRSGSVAAAGALPGPRSDAGVAVLGGTIYLLGGEVSGPTAPLTSVVELRP